MKEFSIPDEKMFIRGGDGASGYQAKEKGSLTRHEKKNPFLLKFWCYSHKGNLILEDTEKKI